MAYEWLYEIFAPTVASVFALSMWFAPMPEILNVRRRLRMNDLNPLPFGLQYCNCLGWMIYGWLSQDYYVVTSNFPGMALACFYMASSIHVLGYEIALLDNKIWRLSQEELGFDESQMKRSIAEEKSGLTYSDEEIITKKRVQFNTMTTFLWVGPLLWGFLGAICFSYLEVEEPASGTTTSLLIVGSFCAVFAMAYFASPLSTALSVIKEKDASSLYPPMVVANIINCFGWIVYGYLAIDDVMVWSQNLAGMSLNVINLTLLIIYPRKRADDLVAKEKEEKDGKKSVMMNSTEKSATDNDSVQLTAIV